MRSHRLVLAFATSALVALPNLFHRVWADPGKAPVLRLQLNEGKSKAVTAALDRPVYVNLQAPKGTIRKVIRPIGPLPPVTAPRDNPTTPQKAELGKLLFFDPRTSGDSSTSCASCHNPDQGWGDGGDLSRGYPGTQHWRNSQTIINSPFYQKLFWAGESTSLESQADSAITGNLAGNGDPMMIEERLKQIPEYRRRFREVFGTEDIRYAWVLKAIAAFERAYVVSEAKKVPFDRYMAGDEKALSPEARKGLQLFTGKARCVVCHDGPLFSDEDYHNLDVPKNPAFEEDPLRQVALRYQHVIRGVDEKKDYRPADQDLGLYYTTKRLEDRGRFRTPSLRETKYTAPYMHNGAFFTLEEVVDFYNQGGGDDLNKSPLLKPLGLSDVDKQELLAFMESLSMTQPLTLVAPKLPDFAATEIGGLR